MNYGVVSRDDHLVHYVPIDLPAARWPHDLGMTEHYSILHDLPFFFDAESLEHGVRKLAFHPDDRGPLRRHPPPRPQRRRAVVRGEFVLRHAPG